MCQGIGTGEEPGSSQQTQTQLLPHEEGIVQRVTNGHIPVIGHHCKQKDQLKNMQIEAQSLKKRLSVIMFLKDQKMSQPRGVQKDIITKHILGILGRILELKKIDIRLKTKLILMKCRLQLMISINLDSLIVAM